MRRYFPVLRTLLLTCGLLQSGTIAEALPDSQSDQLADLRAHSGGYLRPPTHSRVIIFINGIFGDAVSTWQNGNGSYWPDLLATDKSFSDVDIYVHSFDSPKITTAQSIDELASRMNDVLLVDKVLKDHNQVVFICHSMGGLVTRAFLLKYRPDPDQVPMIYFFSTPTTGANITEIAKHVSNNPQLKDMLPLKEDGYVGDLQNAWLATSDDPKLSYPLRIASYCAYEKLNTYGIRIVERQSATSLCNHETRGIVANHIDIVKPSSSGSDSYIFFKAAYNRTFGVTAPSISNAVQEEVGKPIVAQQSMTILSTETEQLSLQRVKASRTYIDVGCEQTRTGEITAKVSLAPGEAIIEVIPTVENADNVSKSSAAVVRFDEGRAVIRYSLRGLDKNAFGLNCPGGGHADIVASFVIRQDIAK